MINNKTTTDEIRKLLNTDNVTLLKVKKGGKKPLDKGWTERTPESATPDYIDELNSGEFNIGVSLGLASDNIITIDIDDESQIKDFVLSNGTLIDTLTTKGNRGINLWYKIDGELPKSGKIYRKSNPTKSVGEIRSTGNQTIIHGKHPSGNNYRSRYDDSFSPKTISFDQIKLPEDWVLSGSSNHSDAGPGSKPFTANGKLNHSFFVNEMATRYKLTYVTPEKQFYQYDPQNGLWTKLSKVAAGKMISTLIHEQIKANKAPSIEANLRKRDIDSITTLLGNHVNQDKQLQAPPEVIHLKNCMLDLRNEEPVSMTFSHEYQSTHQIPFDLTEDAVCPQFKEFLDDTLSEEDQQALQKYCGSIITGDNKSEVILFVTGAGGTGKSTFLKILSGIIGSGMIGELRTKQLTNRFETARYIGRRVLIGNDVSNEFLKHDGVNELKALTGHDLIEVEIKHSKEVLKVDGNFHIIITSNHWLRIKTDGEYTSWMRRLIPIEFNRKDTSLQIPGFAHKLVEEEGAGILTWMIKGAYMIRKLQSAGQLFEPTDKQHQRVMEMLGVKSNAKDYLQARLTRCEGKHLTAQEIWEDYQSSCANSGLQPDPKVIFYREIKAEIKNTLSISQSNNLSDPHTGKAVRGYRNLTFVEEVSDEI